MFIHLQDGNLIAQLTLLFSREAQFVYNLDCHVSPCFPMLSCSIQTIRTKLFGTNEVF